MTTADATTAQPRVDRWNWGAALLTWIWALGHRLWGWALLGFVLSFIPFAGFVLFGLKGNGWAWARGGYASVDELRAKERPWAVAGLVFTVVAVSLIVLSVVVGE